jgi:hypothetical protein
LSILEAFGRLITVELLAALAALSLVALSIVALARLTTHDPKEPLVDAINEYFGIGYFVSSLVIFILGLFLVLVLDSLGAKYSNSLAFEICNAVLKGLPLLGGIILLLGGVDALVRVTTKRTLGFFPRNWSFLMHILDKILPVQKEAALEQKNGGTPEPAKIASPEPDLKGQARRLAEQAGTTFVVALICLWLGLSKSALQAPHRGPWWLFLILSLVALALWFRSRKKACHPKNWWIILCIEVGFIWFAYWITGISVPLWVLLMLAALLAVWDIILFSGLAVLRKGSWRQSRPGRRLVALVVRGDQVYPWLSFLELFAGVLATWGAIWNSGLRSWWMPELLLVGVLVISIGLIVQTWA